MSFFDKFFRRKDNKKYKADRKRNKSNMLLNDDWKPRQNKAVKLFEKALENYNQISCMCAFPRFQQIISIDCNNYGDSFKCFDTDILITYSKKYFEKSASKLNDEKINEKWTCKKCGSIYEYGWSNFRLENKKDDHQFERQKLELTTLKTELTGKKVKKPIPLYTGLVGYSFPSKSEIAAVDYEEFKKYLLEE